ncbi:GntR family transcriptional regulator [Roseateles amylovorans]|uniref:GntR family transcriptional regulator n=1 Tax=Roseateles amylovorans TaxID=2978473 RepID=A0ABY6BAE2_9BURK|nr:GntR family transcriptional regulator [Roseateles amylovorans]UXH80197.1 GntR family transcriptional regulator [Roseateles amylovorans]
MSPPPAADHPVTPLNELARAELAPAFSPLYRQIKGLILQGLQTGEWKAGEGIPSEVELAARFGVSQGTVRKAIDELAADNLLVRRQGKGTFVATHAEQQQQYRFLRLTPDAGAPASLGRQLLHCRRQRAPAWIAKLMHLRAGDPMIEIRRLLHSGGQPVVLDDIWLPGSLFKGLTTERLQEHRGPFYGLLETEFGVHMVRAQEKIRAVAAEEESAAPLQVTPGSPLLSVERLSFTYGDKPVELRRGLYNTTHHFYRNDLH